MERESEYRNQTSYVEDRYDAILDEIATEEAKRLPGEGELQLKPGGRAWRKRERAKKAAEDQELERELARKRAQSKYYRKNKKELNRQRALRNKAPEYAYQKARLRAKANGIPWEFTLEEWAGVWMAASKVVNPANGFLVPAWSMKGSNPSTSTHMVRKDTSKGWSVDNCRIAYKGEWI